MENIIITVASDIQIPNVCGKYLLTNSNFGDAYVKDVPLKILSNPFVDKDEYGKQGLFIKVTSLITGLLYKIPFDLDWMTVYDSYEEIVLKCSRWISRGYKVYQDAGRIEQVVNKDYYPMDNSYSSDINGNHMWVAGKTCRILSVPFWTEVKESPKKKKMIFVQMRDGEKTTGMAYFMEWRLV